MADGQGIYFVILSMALLLAIYIVMKCYLKSAPFHKIYAYPNLRSTHKTIIPTGGGIVFSGLHIVFLLLSLLFIDDIDISESLSKICIGGFLIYIVGFIDDKFAIKPRYKLIGQIVVAIFMFYMGFKISEVSNPFGPILGLGYLSFPVTILWYLLVINAINLIDGLDGLAAGITLISCIVLMIYSFDAKNFLIFISATYMAIALLVFLVFNFPKARCFMGDTGSLYIGFMLASLAIAGNESQFKGITTFTILIPVTVLFIPILDTVFTVFRRMKSKQKIFRADKNHLHHKLVSLGISNMSVSLICWFITLILAIISIGYMFVSVLSMFYVLGSMMVIMVGLLFYIYKKDIFK
jgi:UDP-GlcNAc:undecaprenyl-phosphate GlcNAc-1-phosphate transferase